MTKVIMIAQLFDLSPLQEIADWRVFCFIVLSLVILLIGKLINDKLSGYDLDNELTERDNKAIAISFSGFVMSLCIVISAVLFSPSAAEILDSGSPAFIEDIKQTCLWSSVGVGLLLTARLICDKLMLPRFSNKAELIRDKNLGVGFVQAGSYISTALVLKASLMTPESSPLLVEIGYTVLWFIISQALLIAYSITYQKATKHDIHEDLRKDNTAVGVALSGNIIAFSILLSFFISSYDSILGLIIWAATSMLLLSIVRIAVDKMILPKHALSDELSKDGNWGAGAIEAVSLIGSALIITGSFY